MQRRGVRVETLTDRVAVAWIVMAVPVAMLLTRVSAPYGRHARGGWGPMIPAWIGWVVMEAPAWLVPLGVALVSSRRDPGALVLLAMILLHYLHRDLIWPLRRRSGRDMPATVAAMAVGFNLVNGSLQGAELFLSGPARGLYVLSRPAGLLGLALFFAGMVVNIAADEVLLRLKRANGGHGVPTGPLFRWVSSPNYAGEILEWIGFALVSGSWAGWSFAVWTAANLAPRALTHHRWDLDTFQDYPRERRALIPFVL